MTTWGLVSRDACMMSYLVAACFVSAMVVSRFRFTDETIRRGPDNGTDRYGAAAPRFANGLLKARRPSLAYLAIPDIPPEWLSPQPGKLAHAVPGHRSPRTHLSRPDASRVPALSAPRPQKGTPSSGTCVRLPPSQRGG